MYKNIKTGSLSPALSTNKPIFQNDGNGYIQVK